MSLKSTEDVKSSVDSSFATATLFVVACASER